MWRLHLRRQTVEKCVRKQFDGQDFTMYDSDLLYNHRKLQLKQGITTIPSVVIDGEVYPGYVGAESVENIVEAICDKLEVVPLECTILRKKKVDKEHDLEFIAGGVAWIVGWLVLFNVVVCYGLFLCCRGKLGRHTGSYTQAEF